MHLLPLRGEYTPCGIRVDACETSAEINCVTCARCKQLHEGYCEQEEWSGSPCPDDPDNYWIDDKTGERIKA